jgi:hypothetical protein
MNVMTEGTKVTYVHKGTAKEHGIIKSFPQEDPHHAFVVYNCAGNWDDYKSYTGQRTQISDLKPGWL